MRSYSLRHLSDEDLTRELTAAVGHERQALATLLAHIAEFDARELYLPAGCSSMYRYCVDRLRLSEDAAARRIQVARLARDFPFILQALADGRLHLSGLGLLAPRITRENGHELLMATMGLSKGGVESLVAERFPIVPTAGALFSTCDASASFDASASLAPTEGNSIDEVAPCFPTTFDSGGEPVPAPARVLVPAPGPNSVPVLAPLARVRPVAPGRFELVAVIDQETHDFLMQSRELLGHVVPTNALIDVLARAIRAQHAQLLKRRCGAAERPRTGASRPGRAHGDATAPRDDAVVRRSDSAPQAGRTGTRAPADPRRIPAAVRREVWERDGGRCTFTSADGHRCAERSRIETLWNDGLAVVTSSCLREEKPTAVARGHLDRGLAPAAPEPHTRGARREHERYHLRRDGRTQEGDQRGDASAGEERVDRVAAGQRAGCDSAPGEEAAARSAR